MNLQIKVEIDAIKQHLASLKEQTLEQREEMNRATVEAVAAKVVAQLDAKAQNARTDFWQSAARSVDTEISTTGGEVSIHQIGVRLRYFGGVVTAGKSTSRVTGKPTKALAIPNRQEVPVINGSYATPAHFELLQFIRNPKASNTIGWLFEKLEQPTKGKGRTRKGRDAPKNFTRGRLLFSLLNQTTHKPDPTVLPPESELEDCAIAEVLAYLEGKLAW